MARRRRVLIGGIVLAAVVVAAGATVVGLNSGSSRPEASGTVAVAPGSAGGALGGGAAPEIARDSGGDAAVSSAPSEGTVAPDQAPSVPVGGVTRSLVRTAQLTVEVDDAAAGVRLVRTAAAAVGGFVTEEQSGTGGGWVVLRVPADSLDRLIDDIAGKTEVTARSTQVSDATEQVVDLDARVTSQQAGVARVRALLAQATSIGDIVAIESELSRRESDLDSLTSRLTALRDQVALSTLTVDLRTPGGAVVDDDRAVGFLEGLASGWDGLRALGAGVGAVIGFLLPFVPVVVVLVGMGWLVRRIVRNRRATAPAE